MHKFFEVIDEQLSEFLSVLYLICTMFGTAYFFVGADALQNPSSFLNVLALLALAAGLLGAVAVELHAYLQQRRFRQYNQDIARLTPDHPKYAEVAHKRNVARRWMLALISFQIVSSCGFWYAFGHPTNPFDYFVLTLRGVSIPVFFYASGHLSQLRRDAVGILSKAADKMLIKTMSTTVKQWTGRLKRAGRQRVNLAPVAIDLMLDADEVDSARRVALIENGLSRGESGVAPKNLKAGGKYGQDKTTGLYLPQSLMVSGAKASGVNTQNGQVKSAQTDAKKESKRKQRVAPKKTPRERAIEYLDEHPDATLADMTSKKRGHPGISKTIAVEVRREYRNEQEEKVS